MDREPTTVHIIRLLTQQVEQLRVDHGNEEVKGAVRVRHDEEQGSFFISQRIQLQFVIGSYIPHFLNIKRSQTSTTGNQDRLRSFASS